MVPVPVDERELRIRDAILEGTFWPRVPRYPWVAPLPCAADVGADVVDPVAEPVACEDTLVDTLIDDAVAYIEGGEAVRKLGDVADVGDVGIAADVGVAHVGGAGASSKKRKRRRGKKNKGALYVQSHDLLFY